MKQNMPFSEISSELPIEFEDLLRYTRALNFPDRPDYGYIKKMIDAVLFRAQFADFIFDWKIQHVRLTCFNLYQKKETVIAQIQREKVFMKTELNERRRRWDPSLFKKEAAEG